MKNFTFLFLILGTLISAQNQRFIYDYKFVSDSADITDVKSDLMYLDVTPKSSRFYSYDVYKQDSTRMADFEKQIKTSGSMNVVTFNAAKGKGFVRYAVSKEYPDYKVFLHTRIGRDGYKVLNDAPLTWKIESEKQKIGEFNAQKATTFYQGRKWTAWFTTDIPLQEGPYKFHGLPGLIVKASDDKNFHVFELAAVRKLVEPVDFSKASLTFANNEVSVDYPTYRKLFKENRADPTKSMRQMMSSGMVTNIRDANGNPMDMEKMMREREKSEKERQKKDNNLIDLTLLK